MAVDLIRDRGRGPELAGTRITVYNLLPHFLDPTATEAYICQLYDLTPEQVAAARAYVLNNAESVLAEHLEIEARSAAGNPREVVEEAKRTRAVFQRFKEWVARRQQTATEETNTRSASESGKTDSRHLPTFREWFAQQESRPTEGS